MDGTYSIYGTYEKYITFLLENLTGIEYLHNLGVDEKTNIKKADKK
jgi:phenolic acid decarboxylase